MGLQPGRSGEGERTAEVQQLMLTQSSCSGYRGFPRGKARCVQFLLEPWSCQVTYQTERRES